MPESSAYSPNTVLTLSGSRKLTKKEIRQDELNAERDRKIFEQIDNLYDQLGGCDPLS